MNTEQIPKKLWQIINQVIEKCKHKGCIVLSLSIDGVQTFNPSAISEESGKFYSTLGSSLASKIQGGTHHIDHYLDTIPRNNKV